MKYWILTMNQDHADEHNIPALAVANDDELDKWKDSVPDPYANLGNGGGEYFLEKEKEKKYIGEDYINEGIVEVNEISETFYNEFKNLGLISLSLSNIFDELDEEEDDEDDEGLKKEDYYETRDVGTKARSDKTCEFCHQTIKMGTPHQMHHFYPEFAAYPTHKECSEQFLNNLK